MARSLVPELHCSDLAATTAFYVDVLGFRVLYDRPAEAFAYLARDGADLMFEQADGPGRRWLTGPLERPFGRGVNFQVEVAGVADLYAAVARACPAAVYLPLEERKYECGGRVETNRQFVVRDPDGYLLRFAEFL
jgi:catechol 2,3-dioxygenase-like lactoylglutathione lyase family enzyme